VALVLGIDSSTQSVKVEVRDLDSGAVLGVGRGSHPATTPPRSEQPPKAWWSALVEAVQEAFSGAPGTADPSLRSQVVAMSVAGQQHGMVVLDSSYDVIRPAKLWNDTESARHASALVERIGPTSWADTTGSVPVAAFTVTKLAWLAETEPENFARVQYVLLPHDWLTFKLTGQLVTDRGDASGTGYWSPATQTWSTGLLTMIDGERDWSLQLPKICAPTEVVGEILPTIADELGLPHSVIVGPGSGDNMAAALGIGLKPGDIALSLGTSGTVYAVSATPTADDTGCVAGFADATGNYLPLVCTLNATKVSDFAMRLLGVEPDQFNEMILGAPVGAGGLTLVPYLDGERTPNRPDATGSLVGIRSNATRAEFARASVEGVVCGLLDGLDALGSAGVTTTGRLYILGGGAKSSAYRQTVADLAKRAVVVPSSEEHVATGAAVQAAAVVSGRSAESLAGIAASWGLGAGVEVAPEAAPAQADEVRARYAAARG
jgi:xylulokinase